nr:immunoglobulin heavy chain junction region [Macaca mulatta]MOV55676.1 immunoglobulin heavy chain junction region [Macaca mulatta]MOV57019.1 immunoglobulin heavy chain junction region [Macaca mulatta]MOV60130.1 immunoglobulin heavy chain junction region [Macaca mulatta]MOV60666.1 immunoglobulin heavy chain junction region [Macaca mulatta]
CARSSSWRSNHYQYSILISNRFDVW